MTAEALLIACCLFVASALCGLFGRWPTRAGFAVAAIASGFLIAAAIPVLASGGAWKITLGTLIPFYGPVTLRMDVLSAFFELLIGCVGVPVSLYSIRYAETYSPNYSSGTLCVLYGLVMLAIAAIPVANDVLGFMSAWESMVLLACALVAFEYQDKERARAALIMLAMSEGGAALFLIGFLVLWHFAGSPAWNVMEEHRGLLPAGAAITCFLLALIGFGVKAGLVPLHIWLPIAHPAAPSNLSALLSAVIVKMGVYGAMRVLLILLPITPWWLGAIVVGGGAVTALLGILYALMDTNLKSLLAYSTVENVGIIFTGLGAALVFRSLHFDALAGLALMAVLLHSLSHALCKALLFLGAGAVRDAVGHERDMDDLGGLMRRMPWTGFSFLVGALGIAAIPPFSGYITEWTTLETLLQGVHIPMQGARVTLGLAGAALALTAGIAITCFVRTFGTCFLARPRTEAAANAREAPAAMRVGMGILSLSVILFGLLPVYLVPLFRAIPAHFIGADVTNQIVVPLFTHPQDFAVLMPLGGAVGQGILPGQGQVMVPVTPDSASTSPLYLTVLVVLFLIVAWLIVRARRPRRRASPVWAGAMPLFTARNEYTATGYVHALQLMFRGIYQPQRQLNVERRETPYHVPRITYRSQVATYFEDFLYLPALRGLQRLAGWAQRFQSGSVSLYILYILILLLIVLIIRGM